MKTLALVALLIAQESRSDLARDLSDDLIEVRERAHAALLKMGAPAYPILRRAIEGGDAEARTRALAILKAPAFLSVPMIVEGNIRRLGQGPSEDWEAAIADLLRAGEAALPLLREAARDRDPRLAFRAGQVAAILESAPVDGLRFGTWIQFPEFERGSTVPGCDVLVNVSPQPISLTFQLPAGRVTAVPPRPVDAPAPPAQEDASRRGCGGGSVGNSMTLQPGQVWTCVRYHVITRYDQKGVPWGFGIDGRWTLEPVFQPAAAGSGKWSGRIEGPPVAITVR